MNRRQSECYRNLDDPLKVFSLLTVKSCGLVLLFYAAVVPLLIGWSVGLALHVLAGLLAAALALAFPYRLPRPRVSSLGSLAPTGPIE